MQFSNRLTQEPTIDRRRFLRNSVAAGTAFSIAAAAQAREDAPAEGVTFSFGTYAMKTMSTEEAIRVVAQIGYDGIEIAARPDWDAAPARMSQSRREQIRMQLADSGLCLTALMEHLYPGQATADHEAGLARLRAVARLGHDLSPTSPPLIQTVLGGNKWDEQKNLFLDRLADWARLAEEMKTVIAIKPHRGGAMSKPSEAAWLIQQLDNTPWIRMVYDYSHYAFRDLSLAQTVATALPTTAHIAIKDTIQTDQGFRFDLPGASDAFDYADLFKRYYAGGYRGDICCEVSSMVSSQTDYDPIAAAKTCYANIAPRFEKAGVPRRSRQAGG